MKTGVAAVGGVLALLSGAAQSPILRGNSLVKDSRHVKETEPRRRRSNAPAQPSLQNEVASAGLDKLAVFTPSTLTLPQRPTRSMRTLPSRTTSAVVMASLIRWIRAPALPKSEERRAWTAPDRRFVFVFVDRVAVLIRGQHRAVAYVSCDVQVAKPVFSA